ncbi:MAG: glycosyltransferase, partial [Nitrospiraceae bacterium]|nr:glycosyltransferase [Nitrospiraceae bacterium]
TKTKEAIEKIDNRIKSYFKKNFFSIIIPVYNEEKYLPKLFEKLSKINYDDFEIIAVENGSTDNSYKLLKEYEEKNSKFKVKKSKKGISIAKNEGLKHISNKSDYVIFLDSDTYFEKDFLKELNNFLNKNYDKPYYIGTTAIKPAESNLLYDKIWYKIFDIFHKLSKTSYSIQIAKSDIAKKIGFDEELNFSEDLKFIKDILIFGEFFFVNSDKIYTSTRRFRKNGYFKTVFEWILQAFAPKKIKKNKKYPSYR